MNETPKDIEARLRAALAARADGIEPSGAGEAAVVERMAAARQAAARRRVLLSAAAVVLVLAAVAGALVLAGDDDETDVATSGETTTSTATTMAPAPPTTEPVIWPLPTMSVVYENGIEAAQAFLTQYAGIADAVCRLPGAAGGEAESVAIEAECFVPCPPAAACAGPLHVPTMVRVVRSGPGWVVLGAESQGFDVVGPIAGTVVGADIAVDVTGLGDNATTRPSPPPAQAVAELRPLGQPAGSAPTVDTTTIPLDEDGSWHLILGAADGPVVVIVSDFLSVTARVFTVDSTAFPPETTTTTVGPTDDGVQGWPGPTSRHFGSAEEAAHAFVTDHLGFADPALADLTQEGADAVAVYHPRPTASVSTAVTLHDTGTARGWVVTGVSSPQGIVDSATRAGDEVTVTGRAQAFEAHVDVQLIDVTGAVLGQTFATTTDSGTMAPFEVVVRQEQTGTGPVFVQISEGDASGEGRTNWATWFLLDDA